MKNPLICQDIKRVSLYFSVFIGRYNKESRKLSFNGAIEYFKMLQRVSLGCLAKEIKLL